MASVLNMVGGGGGSPYASIGVSYPAGKICECSNGVDTLQAKVESYNGDIVTFQAEEEVPLLDLDVDITAQQDLHGYDHPWAGGAGKNLFDSSQPYNYSAKTVVFGGMAQYNFNTYLAAGTYTISVDGVTAYCYARLQGTTQNITIKGKSVASQSFTLTESGLYAIWLYNNTDSISASDVNYVQIEVGSTPTSYEPYSNICPISGWSEANVTRCGKNLVDVDPFTLIMGTNRTKGIDINPIPVGTYTVSVNVTNNTATKTTTLSIRDMHSLNFVEVGKISISAGVTGIFTKTFTATVPFAYIYVYESSSETNGAEVTIEDFQIELGSTPTAYEPYDGDTYTIDLDGTRYGGSLDVLTGVLTVTHGYIASYNGESLPSTWISDRDVYGVGITPTTGAEVVYELASPTTVQLTAQQVDTLIGQNVIYADAGDVSVDYTSGYWIFPIKENGTWTVSCDSDSESVEITHKGQVAFVDFVGSGYITSIGYSGNTSVIENDDKVWEVALLTSGTLNVYKPIAVDIFLCGGGGGGGRGGYGGGLGGGGGYTKNLFNIILEKGTYAVTVGDGGAGGTDSGTSGDGGASSITGVDGASANGGYGVAAGGSGAGGNGGSGGGGGTSNNKGAGGSNGSGGAGGSTGQEMSTYAYLDSTDTLYAGGGGGGTRSSTGAAGGAGGGANGGGSNNTGSSAAINTGGGGGGGGGKDSSPYMAGGNGGSGIIRIRTHR